MVGTQRSASTPASQAWDAAGETSPSAGRSPAIVPTPGGSLHLRAYLDASRIQALEHLFNTPGQQGIDLFTRLLACALALSEEASASQGSAGGQYAVMISVESLRLLGKMIMCNSNETITKYMKLFTICGFIEQFKVKQSRRVYLAFPSGPYAPPPTLLADLDALLGSPAKRPKVKQLARQVRARCIAHDYVTSKALGLEEDMPGSLQHILTVLQSEQVDSGSRITKAIGMLTKLLVQASKTPIGKGDASIVDATVSRSRSLGDSSQKPGASAPLPFSPGSDTSTSKVDARIVEQRALELTAAPSPTQVDAKTFTRHDPPLASTLLVDAKTSKQGVSGLQASTSPTQVDARTSTHVYSGATSTRKVDASTSKQELSQSVAPESPAQVDANSPEHRHEVDLGQREVDSCDPANVNVITIITTITFNVKLVAMFCCRALGEPPNKWPIYRKLFQSPEVEHDTRAITAALLYTLAHRDDGSMRNPASVFIQRCKDFHKTPPPKPGVFAEAMDLVERYGELTYQQLTQQLIQQRSQTTQVQAWQPEPHTALAYQTPSRLPPIPPGVLKAQAVHIPLKPGGGMTWETAQRLRGHIAHDIRFGRCRVTPVTLKDGSYGVLVDKTEEQKVRQSVLYSEQEWQQRSATLTSCYALFGEGGQSHLALLKKALKKYE